MIFQKEYMPQFREADPNGLVGVRGYLNYFQDVATHYMHNLGKGNDTLPEEYGICWMYTKYKMHIWKEADFTAPLEFQTWAVQDRSPIWVWQDFIASRQNEVYAEGRVESCLYHMDTRRIGRLTEIDYPKEAAMEQKLSIAPFCKLSTEITDMEYCYTHTVRYTDLDKSKHMNNLLYINLFLNAFDINYFEQNRITDFEIHYLDQCFYLEEIAVYRRREKERILLAGIKQDGTLAVQGMVVTE